jgi:phosphate transport system protein
MSNGEAPVPLRVAFHDELEQLRLQVELMGVRVDQNLERMRHVLGHGDGSGATVAAALAACGAAWDIVRTLVDVAVEQYRTALRAWAAQDLALATQLVESPPRLGSFHERLIDELRRLDGPDAARVAVAVFVAGQAADRIADHAAIIGARLRYLITGEPTHLAAEVR